MLFISDTISIWFVYKEFSIHNRIKKKPQETLGEQQCINLLMRHRDKYIYELRIHNLPAPINRYSDFLFRSSCFLKSNLEFANPLNVVL